MTRFAVLGPGGVGGFLTAALARAGVDVTVIARAPTVEVIERDGLRLNSVTLGALEAHPPAQTQLTEPVDVLFIATKATGLQDALERIRTDPRLVVPLLNGLDHLDLLRRRFGSDRVPAATIRIEADRPAPGQVIHSSPAVRVEMAFDDPAAAQALPPLSDTLNRAQVPTRIERGERQVMWSKLVRLNALASTTSAADRPVGEIRSDPEWRATLLACVDETAAVANADGAAIDPQATIAELDGAHPGLGSSMQRDLAAGREPELDAIQGSVLRAAARHGLRCPTVSRLADEIARRAGISPPSLR